MDPVILDKIHKRIIERSESVSESICIAYPDLLVSDCMDTICCAAHSLRTIEESIKLIEYTYFLYKKYKCKIIVITRTNDPMYFVYSKMQHILATLSIDRFIDVASVLKKCHITKILYCPNVIEDFVTLEYPEIVFPQYDDSDTFLSFRPQYLIAHDSEYPEVMGSNPCAHFVKEVFEINEPQIVFNEEMAVALNNGLRYSGDPVDLAMSLMLKYTLISIDENKYNIFNYLTRCVTSTPQ